MAATAPPFPFFVGCPRSGTTLLRAMFDSHPELAVPYDSYFLLNVIRTRGRYEQPQGFALAPFLADVFEHWQFRRWGLSQEEVRDALRDVTPQDVIQAARAVFGVYAARQGKPRYGDKTPSYLPHLVLLAEAVPEARFVHLIRDGRDVALSWVGRDWGPSSLAQAAVYWVANVESGRRAGRWLGPDRYVEVQYERLVIEPEPTVRRLCAFLDLPFDPAMLTYSRRAPELAASDPNPGDHQGLFRPPVAGVRDWRRDMSSTDAAAFHVLAGDVLEQLGYDRPVAAPRSDPVP